MASMEPEAYTFTSTDFAPNNKLPVLVYRNILKQPVDEQSVTEQLTKHNWRKLGAWGHIPKPHFHPNTHECYGVFAGTSTLRLGAASFNDAKDGEEKKNHLISVGPGDVIILPAGTCHSCVESKDGYRYVGVYPENNPKYRSIYSQSEAYSQQTELKDEVSKVELPQFDPLFGADGPLKRLWSH